MERKIIKYGMFIIAGIATILTFVWYGWKLFVIIILLIWANNIDLKLKR